jgi:hypothetical protein
MKLKTTIQKGKRGEEEEKEEEKEEERKEIDTQMEKMKMKKTESTRNYLQKRREGMNGKLEKKRK